MARQSLPKFELALLLRERSLTIAETVRPLVNCRGAAIKMKLIAVVLIPLFSLCGLRAQESPTSFPSTTVAASPTGTATPTASPARNVRISFLPPPLEGTISLGVYDATGKLVRVLHEEAMLDEFAIGEDGLTTKWDGRNSAGEDLPRGKYHARGYVVANLTVEPASNSVAPDDAIATLNVRIKLVPNPLEKDQARTIELGAGFDDDHCFLKTADGLPLFTVDEKRDFTRVIIKKSGERSVEVWEERGGTVEQFHLSNINKIMAFDCGEFELK
jgi:hypothetical protein